jgi:hypothetical protein
MGAFESDPMHSASWLLLAIVALIASYGLVCAYRLACTTVGDLMFLMLLAGAAMGAGYLFG